MSTFYKKGKSTVDIEVEWTGRYPNLCRGEWIIKINGIVLVDKNAPEEYYDSFLRNNMGTESSYSFWYFDDNYTERWKIYYEPGDYKNDWYESVQGIKMLEILNENGVILSEEALENLYKKISDKDWRGNSCGGCI